jgi:hypothetical protein
MSYNVDYELSRDGVRRALVGCNRMYGKDIVVMYLDTPVKEPVKKVMLLLKELKYLVLYAVFLCFLRKASVSGFGIEVDLILTWKCGRLPKSFGSVSRLD